MSDESPPRQRWWNIEGWGLRRKVTAVLAVPVTVAMVLGGLRVQEELSNAVHFSSAADQVVAVPDIVEFSTSFATVAASVLAAAVTPQEMDELGKRFDQVRPLTENPEFDPAVSAELTRALATAEELYLRLRSGPVPAAETAQVANEVRDSLNQIVETLLSQVSDEEVREYGARLTTAWYSQRHLFGQVLGIYQLLENPATPDTALVSASGGELAMLDLLAHLYPLGDQQISDLRRGVEERLAIVDAAGEGPLPIINLRTSMLNSVAIYDGIIQEASGQISSTIQARASETRSAALRDTAIVLATLLAALVLALLVSRSLVGPIRRLRYGTLKVARQELPEAIDRIKVGDSIEDIEFTRVPVHTTEEIGQLARAVDDMHGQALRLAGEQAHLRLQINDMFETLARRSKSLVEQQLGLIERLEYEEKDPNRLESLFRLDHLAARMRRNGDNLLILSGTRMRRGHSAPVQLGDILRAAMSEVEDYQRVQIGSTPDGALSGAVATDIVHLLAELVDNSLRASPPDSTVTFSFARAVDGGLLVEIADRGIGIPADELELINRRLAQGGEVGPDTARHMGLFVVSRLAERHGLTVRLRPTFDTARNPGITASVHIPDVLLVSPLALSQTGPQPFTRADFESEALEAPAERNRPQLPAPGGEPEPTPAGADDAPSADPAPASAQEAPSGLPQRSPGATPGLPQRTPAPSGGLPQRSPGSTPGLPQRSPGSTPGLPQRSPGATPGLPQRTPAASGGLPQRDPGATPGLPPSDPQQAPRRIAPDAAAAFASALPSRAGRPPAERPSTGPSVIGGEPREPQPADGREQRSADGAAPTGFRSEPVESRPERAPRHGAVDDRPAPGGSAGGSGAAGSGLPQRNPGSTPGLPPRPAPVSHHAPHPPAPPSAPPSPAPSAPPSPAPSAPPAPAPADLTDGRGGLPQRRPGSTPGLPPRPDRGAAPAQPAPAQPAPAQPAPAQPAPAQPVSAQPAPAAADPGRPAPAADLPQRRPAPAAGPGTSPAVRTSLPHREPGSTPGLPDTRRQTASIADGGSVSSDNDAQQAARHRYRTNSAKTASFFQPRPDVNALRPHPAAGTPIFTDMMSDWLVDPTNLPEDRRKREWHSAADAGWKAAQQAVEAPVVEHTTAGLPRRAPGARLVPGAVRQPATGEMRTIRRRDPEAIRANLSRHQQGVRNGRASATASNRENNEQGVR